MMAKVDVKKLIGAYIKLRSMKEEISNRYKKELAEIDEKMDTVETAIKKLAGDNGVDSFKTDVGTASIVPNMKVSCNDWPAFMEFLKDKDPLVFLGKRVSVTSIRDYMDMHGGSLPPGINVFKELGLRVTASRSSKETA